MGLTPSTNYYFFRWSVLKGDIITHYCITPSLSVTEPLKIIFYRKLSLPEAWMSLEKEKHTQWVDRNDFISSICWKHLPRAGGGRRIPSPLAPLGAASVLVTEDRCQFSLRWERSESDREKTRLCPSLSLWDVTGGYIISPAALTHSVNQQRWKRTPDKHTHTRCRTDALSLTSV